MEPLSVFLYEFGEEFSIGLASSASCASFQRFLRELPTLLARAINIDNFFRLSLDAEQGFETSLMKDWLSPDAMRAYLFAKFFQTGQAISNAYLNFDNFSLDRQRIHLALGRMIR